MMEFTDKQLENWKRYEEVRERGRYNMLDPRALEATGMDRDDYIFTLENFSALKAAYITKQEPK